VLLVLLLSLSVGMYLSLPFAWRTLLVLVAVNGGMFGSGQGEEMFRSAMYETSTTKPAIRSESSLVGRANS
jgi:hypothetical protein